MSDKFIFIHLIKRDKLFNLDLLIYQNIMATLGHANKINQIIYNFPSSFSIFLKEK
jgi:hypothetical protein